MRTHIVVSAAYRPFAQGVFYNALVSAADHLQCFLRSRGHMCPAELLLQEGEFLVYSSTNFRNWVAFNNSKIDNLPGVEGSFQS